MVTSGHARDVGDMEAAFGEQVDGGGAQGQEIKITQVSSLDSRLTSFSVIDK